MRTFFAIAAAEDTEMVPIRRIQSRSCGDRDRLATAVASLAAAALLPATGGAAFLGDNGPILFTATAAGSPAPTSGRCTRTARVSST